MENFDAIGRWRTTGEDGAPIDASGGLPSGAAFEGVAGLKKALLRRPDVFVPPSPRNCSRTPSAEGSNPTMRPPFALYPRIAGR